MADDERSPPTLLSIAPELFGRIADVVDGKDLLNLRLVCRESNDKTMHTYVQKHFTTRAFLLSDEESLRCLVAISGMSSMDNTAMMMRVANHGTVGHERYSRSLRMIYLSTEQISQQYDEYTAAVRKGDVNKPDEERKKLNKAARRRKGLIYKQQQLMASESDLHLLTVAFSRLRCFGNVPAICAGHARYIGGVSYRARTLERLRGKPLTVEKSGHTTRIVLQALRLSALAVQNFAAFNGAWLWNTLHHPHANTMLGFAKEVFQNLTELQLSLDSVNVTDPEAASDEVKTLVDLFTNLTQLKTLGMISEPCSKLGSELSRGSTIVAEMLRTDFAALTDLWLLGMTIDMKTLSSFVERHSEFHCARMAMCTLISHKALADKLRLQSEESEESEEADGENQVKVWNGSLEGYRNEQLIRIEGCWLLT